MKTITVRNHNDVIIYQGNCYMAAAKEKRNYEFQTGNICTVTVE